MLHSSNPLLGDQYNALDTQLTAYASTQITGAPDDPIKATRHFVRTLGDAGLTALLNPSESTPLDSVALCRTREMLSYHASLCDTAFAMQGLGSHPVLLAGNAEMRKQYVAPTARGEKIAAFAITEPHAGSDVAAMTTTAIRQGDQYRLDGTKTLISNAGIADFYTVFAKTNPTGGRDQIVALVVDANTQGLDASETLELIAPHPIGTLHFSNCLVPANRLLDAGAGGFEVAMQTLDRFRATVGAAALGLAERAFDEAISYTRNRKQFGKRLCDLPTIRDAIGEMVAHIESARMLVYKAAVLANADSAEASLAASTAKYVATESAQWVVDRALQLHGGYGVVKGYTVERLYREVRALRLYEGTSEIQKAIMAKQILHQHEMEA